MAKGLLACFCLLSESSHAEEDWKKDMPPVRCDFQAWADDSEIPWLDNTDASKLYLEKVKSNKIDFTGNVMAVPYKRGCGEVWVAACPGHESANKWVKLKGDDKCDPTTSTATSTATETNACVNTAAEPVSAPEAPNAPTASTEPARATCAAPEPEPCEPGVTDRMRRSAEGIPELQDEFHRHNHALEGGAPEKGVADATGGAEVNDEVASWANDTDVSPAQVGQRYTQTTGKPWTAVSRDSVALVSQKGFSRRITTLYQVYRVHEQARFHNDGEGVNLSLQHTGDEERTHQLELAAALETVKDKLSKQPVIDHDSIAKTEEYRQLALVRAKNLAAISCQLSSMAAIDADRDRRQRSLASGPIHNTGPGSDPVAPTSSSGITGTSTETMVQIGPGGVKISNMTFTNTSTSTFTFANTELEQTLAPFGPVDPPKLDNPDIGDENTDLFARTHQKLQEKEKKGTFRGTIVEEDPIQLVP